MLLVLSQLEDMTVGEMESDNYCNCTLKSSNILFCIVVRNADVVVA